MCPQGQEDANYKKGFMDFNLYKRLIQDAARFEADVNLFLGGESLLHPRLYDMIAYCRDQGVPSRLYTNATLLDAEKSEHIIRAGLDHITFSFDGMDKELYEKYRKGASFDKTLANVKEFLEIKKALGAGKPFVVIQSLQFQDRRYPASVKKEFKKRFDAKMVNRFTFIQPHSFAGAYKASSKKNKRHYSPCAFLWYSMSISWDGTVVPCCIDVYKKYPLGNVHEHSLEALWNSENLVKLRKQICQGGYAEIELCSDCDVLWKSRFMGIPTKSLYNFIELITHRL